MKTFKQLWEEFEPNHKPYTLGIKPFIQAWFNRGANEKEKEMLEFAEFWARHKLDVNWCMEHPYDDPEFKFNSINEAFQYWKENVKNERFKTI